MIGPRFTEDIEEIADSPPPVWATLLHPLIATKNASFYHILADLLSGCKVPDNGAPLVAIMGQEEGPGNPQRSVRDLRKSWRKFRTTPNLGEPLSGP